MPAKRWRPRSGIVAASVAVHAALLGRGGHPPGTRLRIPAPGARPARGGHPGADPAADAAAHRRARREADADPPAPPRAAVRQRAVAGRAAPHADRGEASRAHGARAGTADPDPALQRGRAGRQRPQRPSRPAGCDNPNLSRAEREGCMDRSASLEARAAPRPGHRPRQGRGPGPAAAHPRPDVNYKRGILPAPRWPERQRQAGRGKYRGPVATPRRIGRWSAAITRRRRSPSEAGASVEDVEMSKPFFFFCSGSRRRGGGAVLLSWGWCASSPRDRGRTRGHRAQSASGPPAGPPAPRASRSSFSSSPRSSQTPRQPGHMSISTPERLRSAWSRCSSGRAVGAPASPYDQRLI